MKSRNLMKVLLCTGLLCILLAPPASLPLAAPSEADAGKRFTLDELYTLPRIIGSAPRVFSWSRDGRRLSFLWNDEGTNFYDVWSITTDDLAPRRITRMPRRAPVPLVRPGATQAAIGAADDVEQDRGVEWATWHPDGQRVLLSFRGDLYLAATNQAPTRLTDTRPRESQVQYSPDGKWLSFASAGEIWFLDAAASSGDDAKQLTKLAQDGVSVESYEWAPDSSALAVIEVDVRKVPKRKFPDYLLEETDTISVTRPFPGEEPPRRRLGIVAAQGGEVRWATLGGTPHDYIHSYAWGPDSRGLLVDRSDLYVKDRRLLIVDRARGTSSEWYREQEPENVTDEWSAQWAPDGRGIYFTSDRDEDYHIYFVASAGAAPTRITRGPWAVSSMEVSGSAKAIFFVANEGRPEERHVYRVGLQGGSVLRVSQRPGLHAPVYSPDGRHAADWFSSDEIPYDLFLTRLDVASPAQTSERQVTHSPLAAFKEYTWARPQYVRFPSRADGATLHGRLTLPVNLDKSKKYPAILGSVYSNSVRNQWGGRIAHPTWGLDQFLVQEGYVLLNVDIHGSSGHGRAFRRALRQDYGGIDVEDLHSGVDFLRTLGFVDMDRIGIWGSSYGGLMTAMSLFRKPGVYKAGVAGAPATNVWHAMTGEMRVMMAPQDFPKAYEKASPFTHAAGLQDHLMIIHGMRDTVVLYKDSVALVQRLILLGKDVDLVTLPDAPHGWDVEGLPQTRYAFRKLVEHFDRYLGRGAR